jgi:LppP/LprE lipoprotein
MKAAHIRTLAGGIAFAGAIVGGAAVHADAASWLDAAKPAGWNKAAAAIPKAPSGDESNLPRCSAQVRKPATREDKAVVAAGWRLFNAYQLYDGTSVVTAMSGADGMCRPTGYQEFVFVDGTFAGTLSPKPMDSRTDGALEQVFLYAASSIPAQFLRYTEADPLCCASRTSTVTFRIDRTAKGPVAVPVSVSTTKNS